MNNFSCDNCHHEFFIPHYTIGYDGILSKSVYKSKTTNKHVECPECHGKAITPIEKSGDYTTLEIGKYTALSIEDRKNLLKQRSHEHFEREIKDKKRAIDTSEKQIIN